MRTKGGPNRSGLPELSELKAATRPLEAELGTNRAPDEMLTLTRALVDRALIAPNLHDGPIQRLAVDDAGNGCASLQRLVDVRPEIVRLDRGLTAQAGQAGAEGQL
jgi:hypothetical protein